MTDEKPDDMRLCKYSLTLEAWVWSIVLIPFILLWKGCKYINFCLALSLFRMGWVPFVIINCMYIGSFSREFIIENDGILGLHLLVLLVIGIFGVASWFHIASSHWIKENIYIRERWLWK